MNAGTEMPHREGEVHAVEVVEIVAAKYKTTNGNCADKKREKPLLPVDHVWNEAIGWPSQSRVATK